MLIIRIISSDGNYVEVGAFSVDEFADWAGISRSIVYEELDEERLFANKVGQRTVIWYPEAERWRANLPPYVSRRRRPKSGA